MLDRLRQMAIFARTVEHGSFSGAARALNLSTSVVSHHISSLEKFLDSPLLYRSTRRLSLTHHGEQMYASAIRMLEAAEDGIAEISDAAQEPAGALRVTAPAVLSRSFLVNRFADFAIRHPRVSLNLDFTDLRRDMVAEGIDVAIRMGWLQDSTLKARKLQNVERVLVATEDYLKGHDTPREPEDIVDWDWIGLSPVDTKPHVLRHKTRQMKLKTGGRLVVSDANALYGLTRCGAGISLLPRFLVEDDLAAGKLRRLLPEWEPEPIAIHAVWQPNAPRSGLVGKFVDAVTAQRD
jgi:DNA-binding transcriptional LysR family regulator